MIKLSLPVLAMAALGLSIATTHAADCGNANPPKPTIIEIVTFKTAPSISDTDFLKTVAEMETSFLCKTPGFVRRTLSKGEDGIWFDYVEWASLKEAKAAFDRSLTEPLAAPFIQSIVPESVAVKHWQLLSETK